MPGLPGPPEDPCPIGQPAGWRIRRVRRRHPFRACQLQIAGGNAADAIAAVFSPSFRTRRFLPEPHKMAEDRWLIGNVILRDCEVTVADRDGWTAGFLARQDAEIRMLDVDPGRSGRGAGSLLIKAAVDCGLPGLELWCFRANERARRFYEARGFRAVRFADGADNEERAPDLRYRWKRQAISL